MIMENMVRMGYILLIMCCVLILIAMVTQLHKKDLKEAFNQQLYFSKKLLHFDESIIQECPTESQSSRQIPVVKVLDKYLKSKKMELPGPTQKVTTAYDQGPEECEMVYADTYRYGEIEDSNKDLLVQSIREKECTNPLTSCKLEFDYHQVRKFTPIEDHRAFCHDSENIVHTHKYKCPNTDICNSSCDGITFNGKCYRAISMEFFFSNLINRSWRIRDPLTGRFINDDRDETLQLLQSPKSFKFQQHTTGFFIVQNNDANRRWGIYDGRLKHVRDPSNHVYVEMYTVPGINNKGLIKVIDQRNTFLGWLSVQELRLPGGGFGFIGSSQRLHKLQLTPYPMKEWEIIKS